MNIVSLEQCRFRRCVETNKLSNGLVFFRKNILLAAFIILNKVIDCKCKESVAWQANETSVSPEMNVILFAALLIPNKALLQMQRISEQIEGKQCLHFCMCYVSYSWAQTYEFLATWSEFQLGLTTIPHAYPLDKVYPPFECARPQYRNRNSTSG